MTRNTERRVEVGAPILDQRIRDQINHIVDIMMHDTSKARILGPDKLYYPITDDKGAALPPYNCQEAQAKEAIANSFPVQKSRTPDASEKPKHKPSFFSRLFHRDR